MVASLRGRARAEDHPLLEAATKQRSENRE
jgi:hypothetical protein